jgi:hypothetical protein
MILWTLDSEEIHQQRRELLQSYAITKGARDVQRIKNHRTAPRNYQN